MLEVSFVNVSPWLVILANKKLDRIVPDSQILSVDLILPK